MGCVLTCLEVTTDIYVCNKLKMSHKYSIGSRQPLW